MLNYLHVVEYFLDLKYWLHSPWEIRTMKIFTTVTFLTLFLISNSLFASDCYPPKAARQIVKAIVALEDIVGISSYFGGVTGDNPIETEVLVEPHYISTKDTYKIRIRNTDCRIIKVELLAENVPL